MEPKLAFVPKFIRWNLLILICFTFLTACETMQTTPSRTTSENTPLPARALTRINPQPVTDMPQLALVIGNTDYEHRPLDNTVNDANDIAKQLGQMGFDVTLKTNLNQVAMETAIGQFTQRLAAFQIRCTKQLSTTDLGIERIGALVFSRVWIRTDYF
jgi:hypothetical protein